MVRAEFALPDDTVVVVNELECSEPGCAPIHTAIFVFWPESVENYKLQRPMAEVEASDIQALALTRRQPNQKRSTTE
jgi:nitrate reductase delta subunit